jgi:thiol-disulfide isomerase/thioredoxin
VALLGLAFVGCSSPFKKKEANNRSPVLNDQSRPFWSENSGRDRSPIASVPTSNTGPADANATGILAGRVIDSRDRTIGVSYVQIQPADERSGQAPIDVETSPQGHFTVRGLVPGQSYRLTARTRQDGKVAVGEVVARPPDAKLLISVSDDLAPVSASIPARPLEKAQGVAPLLRNPAPPGELGPPRTTSGDYFPQVPAAENYAASNSQDTPRANIAPPGLPGTLPQPAWEPQRTNGPVPECLISGGKVLTLRLNDCDGRTWDFSQHRGRLVLIDFWGSWCTPCLKAIPEIAQLQQQYRTRGLEVVGIACENGTTAENVKQVRAVRRRISAINYPLLLSGEPTGDPVRAQFKPPAYPYLVLLDGDGTILWKGISGHAITEVEPIIRSRLGNP